VVVTRWVPWVPLFDLAHAYARGTADPAKVKRFEDEFITAHKQTSYEAACWIALYSIKLHKAGDHIKRLVMACPVRVVHGAVEIDMNEVVWWEQPPMGVPCLAGGLRCVCATRL
jgi:hypothetical protein